MIPPPEGLTADDFERIEAAVMETERGRWFLLEFAHRQRADATAEIVAAIAALEARFAVRELSAVDARRDAARAAASLAEAVQKLHAFAIGVDAAPAAVPALTREAPPSGHLERRLTGLQALDALDPAAKAKLFG